MPPMRMKTSSSADHPLPSSAVEIEIGREMATTPTTDESSKDTRTMKMMRKRSEESIPPTDVLPRDAKIRLLMNGGQVQIKIETVNQAVVSETMMTTMMMKMMIMKIITRIIEEIIITGAETITAAKLSPRVFATTTTITTTMMTEIVIEPERKISSNNNETNRIIIIIIVEIEIEIGIEKVERITAAKQGVDRVILMMRTIWIEIEGTIMIEVEVTTMIEVEIIMAE